MAEVLAKIGGTWYPERAQSARKAVNNRHREVARVIIGAVERSKAGNQNATDDGSAPERSLKAQSRTGTGEDELHVGATVMYRPPSDNRTLACRIRKLKDGRAYVVPEHREIGWVSIHSLLPLKPNRVPDDERGRASARGVHPSRFSGRTLKKGQRYVGRAAANHPPCTAFLVKLIGAGVALVAYQLLSERSRKEPTCEGGMAS
ncbi:hypothetical protein [Microvirga brassicacearum]|uniref:Uncharacterized protein n=1 Tax=Microvirga brassicacearum TaxID=2580413 RepID=A0A5N3P5V1_9HYPH|nr:hypothetical protein [Microvirga brassicacearum]KAB0265075.1 hypothetical protein FEZ63_20230 [Microvirga brassicacearum]